MAVFKSQTDEEKEFWERNKDYRYIASRHKIAKALGVPPRRISVKLLREYLYTVGIKPNEFLIRRQPSLIDIFEIRFDGPEVTAILELSGILKEFKG